MNFNLDMFIVIIYLILTLAIGIWKGRGIKTTKDYAVSDKNYSTIAVVTTIFATFIGGGTTIGVIEKIYIGGISFGLMFYGMTIQKFIIAQFIASNMYKFNDAISCGDIMGKLYGKFGQTVTGIATFIKGSGSVAAQIAAIGYIFYYYLGFEFNLGVIIGAGVVILYSTFGGIKSVTSTDILQFFILIVAIPILYNIAINKIGGYSELFSYIKTENIKFLPEKSEFFNYILPVFLLHAIPFDAPMGQRLLIARDQKQIRNSMLISAFIEIPFIFIIAIIAITATLLYPNLDSKTIVPHLVNELLPIGIKGFLIAGFLAIIMSTADSFLNTSSVALSHDILKTVFSKKVKNELLLTKFITLSIGLFGIIIALYFKDIISIITNIFGIWSSTVMIPMFFGILGIKIKDYQFKLITLLSLVIYIMLQFKIINFPIINASLVGLFINSLLFFSFVVFNSYANKSLKVSTSDLEKKI